MLKFFDIALDKAVVRKAVVGVAADNDVVQDLDCQQLRRPDQVRVSLRSSEEGVGSPEG